jgi:molybdopterin-dependent oxidoreductase alpha subunit
VKVILEEGQLDWDFIDTHTEGFEEFKQSTEAADWDDIVEGSGISRERITKLGLAVASSKRLIICWAMGLTQHRNSVSVIQEIANLLLMGGHFGRAGAGACPVRGHSNVQGDRTVGIQHNPNREFLDRLEEATGIGVPHEGGYDTVQAVKAMLNGEVRLFMGMGGNLVSAMSDTEQVANGMRNVDLTVQVSTKLNRSHLVTGREALILPCLGRTEIDQQASGEQFVTVENSMSVVHMSRGSLTPASEHLLSEPAIVAGIGTACFGSKPFDWGGVLQDYDSIREVIEQVIPGFQGFNSRVREDGGFYLPNGPRDGPTWDTPSGKAQFTVHDLPNAVAESGQFTMMTVRSHDQYNTTIYGMDDRYRGVYGARRVVLMNSADMAELGIDPGDEVDLTSHFQGRSIHAPAWKVVAYEIPRGNLCTYFPEANVLVPLESVAEGSNTPTSKSVAVTVSLP